MKGGRIMDLQVLISTMDLKNANEHNNLINKMNLTKSKTLTINQCPSDNIFFDVMTGFHKVKTYNEKGLSKSRNKAIENSNSEICLIADDDIYYEEDFEKKIIKAYKENPKADIIVFFVDNKDRIGGKKRLKEGKIGYLHSMKIQSVQMSFKRASISEKRIKFCEDFGAGSENYMGEENIFIFDCLRSGMNITSVPLKIGTIMDTTSSWFNKIDEKYLETRGAVFVRMSKCYYHVFIIQFAVRKRGLYKENFNCIQAIKHMYNGAKKYKGKMK